MNNNKKSNVSWQEIFIDQNENLRIYGFEKSLLKTIITYLLYVLSIGWIRLLFHWYPRLYLYATHKRCTLICATKILAIDDYQGKYKSYFLRNIQTISTRDIKSAKDLLATLDTTADEDVIEKIRNKKMQINLENGTYCEVCEYKAFWHKKKCYIWDTRKNLFSRLVGFDNGKTYSDFYLGCNRGLSKDEQLLRRLVYGNNEIVVPLQSIGVLLLLEVLNPFYIFQIFTLIIWFVEGYLYYTFAIILMSFFGITSSIIQIRKNQMNLRGTVTSSEIVRVLRDTGTFDNISSKELVPGDLIELPKHQTTLVCDAVLLTGQCILNESMLTGESIPVTKTSLPLNHVRLYNTKECTHHTLYSGTTIIQTRSQEDRPVLARVIKTGFLTNRGALIAAILYPPPADFKFDQDSYKFIGIMACIAVCGVIYTVVSKASRGITPVVIAIKALDIITIVIPPALPAAMTVGKLYAQARLKRAQIYCINNRVINVSGSVNCVCFDKTGTLTEEGLDMWGIVPCTNGIFGKVETDITNLKHHPLFEGMLVCHGLTLIDEQLCGDPLDIKMFESTKWILKESNCTYAREHDTNVTGVPTRIVQERQSENTNLSDKGDEISEISIIQQYQFSASLQRMSVIARVLKSDDYTVYTKGSPEMIATLSKAETLPDDIALVLEQYTRQGYRVIAMGRRTQISESSTKISELSRELVERNLEFLGLVILENKVKQPTASVIMELREANIRVVMITGDNIQTAVSVAKECGILLTEENVVDVTITVPTGEKDQPKISFNALSESPLPILKSHLTNDIECGIIADCNYKFILTGQTWRALREYFPDLIDRICVRGAIFARMSSDQKQQLVMELMGLGYYVAMCGDGANDCGALKAANVGISLSEAESSVASPFTSRIPDITCVPKVIREGRAALVTSFGIFKFMIAYSLTQFLSVIILYAIDSNLSDLEFLFIDICLIINFAFFFGKTRAYTKKLSETAPMTSLLSFTPLLSLTVHMSIMILFQAMAYHTVRQFSWYRTFSHTTDDIRYTYYENYSVFCVSIFQYITLAIIFSRGKPYRRAIYTNGAFMFSIFMLTLICVYITVYPANWIINALQLMMPPVYDWRLTILALALINFLICFFIEILIIERLIENILKRKLYKPEKSKKRYLRVEYELRNCGTWPILNKEQSSFILGEVKNVENMTSSRNLLNITSLQTTDSSNNSMRLKGKQNKKKGFENPGFVSE